MNFINLDSYNRLTFFVKGKNAVKVCYVNTGYEQACLEVDEVCNKNNIKNISDLKIFNSQSEFEKEIKCCTEFAYSEIFICRLKSQFCIVCMIADIFCKEAYFLLKDMDSFFEDEDIVDYASQEDIKSIYNKFNDTADAGLLCIGKKQTVIDLFLEQVHRCPENTAVCFKDRKLTYSGLDVLSSQIAVMLTEQGIRAGDFVAISCQRSIEMIAAILGVLKAGCIYVPIDPSFPKIRVEYILNDCNAKAVITYHSHIEIQIPVIDLESGQFSKEKENNKDITGQEPENLAYCIYTSGTAGNPKGVLVKNVGLTHYVCQFCRKFEISDTSVILQQAYVGFDTSIEEIFPALISGGKIVIFDMHSSLNLKLLKKCIKDNGVNIISCSPLLLNELNQMQLKNVRVYISGGDVLKYEYVDNIVKKFDVYNTYGPTESTVCASYYKLSQHYEDPVSIGKPISNTRIYILNQKRICGIGMCGELCIAGIGLAEGYLNQQELTAQKFVTDFRFEERLYHTGDLARWRKDGSLEYLGRIDDQVKVRGYRIELGEIDKALCNMDDINDAVTIVQKGMDGVQYICSFYTSFDEIASEELKRRLRDMFPEYMIPAFFKQIEKMPVTRNGKIDRNCLSGMFIHRGPEYEEPVGKTEKSLAEYFQAILHVSSIGRLDNFFELGGHSLKAAKLINQIYETYSLNLSLKHIMENPRIIDLAALIEKGEGKGRIEIKKVERKRSYPLSPVQRGIYVMAETDKQSTAYNIFEKVELQGKIKVDRMKDAFSKLLHYHEALRISFELDKGIPKQKVNDDRKITLQYLEVEDVGAADKACREFIRPFDLYKGPLIRGMLIRFAGESYYLIIDTHHIISDGLSIEILLSDLAALYNGEKMKSLPISYLDYCEWTNTRDLQSQKDYWINLYAEESVYSEITPDRKRPACQSFKGRVLQNDIDPELKAKIQQFTNKNGITEYMFFMSVLSILVSFYSREKDIVIGSPFSGRLFQDMDKLCGMFVNTVAVRLEVDAEKAYMDYLEHVKESCFKAYENQEYPFDELVAKVVRKKDPSKNPIFGIMLAVQNFEQAEIQFSGAETKRFISTENEMCQFDLSLDITSWEDIYCLNLEYCMDLYEESSMWYFMRHFINLVQEIITRPDKKIAMYSCIDAKEQKLLVPEQNILKFDDKITVVGQFEAVVKRKKEHMAVKFLEDSITYRELNEKANAVAYEIRKRCIGKNDIVAVIPERKIAMICVILGVIKSGAAYLPIDISYPEERIRYMIKDSGAKCVITVGKKIELQEMSLHFDDVRVMECKEENPVHINYPEDLAYIIYTSGTTGRPKGVAVEHRNLLNLIYSYTQIYDMTPKDTVLQFASIAFDQSVLEIFHILLVGGTLCLLPFDMIGNVMELEEYLNKQGVTAAGFTPAYLRELNPMNLPAMRMIESGGAAAEKDILDKWRAAGKKVYNTYGPTETTVNALTFVYDRECCERLPIGKAMHNVSAYVLYGNKLCGVGMQGELCISGAGVARGYLNHEELTNQKFVKDPYGNGRMYRSGDLVRMLPDGNIDYLGRIDEQVKIRGFRIELGEIENVLRSQKGISDAAVVVRKDQTGENCILGYVTSSTKLDMKLVREGMKRKVPEYMVPLFIVQLEKIPMTKNGKVDKKALPEIEITLNEHKRDLKTKEEKEIARIFTDVLGVKQVGAGDDFFELGGHSLKAARIIHFIEETMHIRLSLSDILMYSTVESLAALCAGREAEVCGHKKFVANTGKFYRMSPAQRRMYTTYVIEGKNKVYNMPEAIRITGKLDRQKLSSAFSQLVRDNDILRTSYLMRDGNPAAYIVPYDELPPVCIKYVKCTESEVDGVYEGFVREFDLSLPPLIKLCAVCTENTQWYLFLDIHHIAADGISVELIWRQLSGYYNGKLVKKSNFQYADYCQWLYCQQDRYEQQKKYWLEQFEKDIPVLNLPEDYSRPKIKSAEGKCTKIRIKKELALKITELARSNDVTEFMIFLSALYILLAVYSRQDDIIVGTAVSGRDLSETDHMIGMFVNMVGLRARPEKGKKCADFIKEVRDICLSGIKNQDYPYEELIDLVDADRNMARNPLFDVMLVQQDGASENIEFGGCVAEMDVFSERVQAAYDLVFNLISEPDGYLINVEYSTAVYSKDTAVYLAVHYVELLKNLTEGMENTIWELDYFDEDERNLLVHEFNATEMEFPNEETFFGIIEKQAEKTPDNIALVGEQETLTYQEMNMRANTVALKLRSMGIGRNDFVVIITGRSIEMVIGLLGIMKAGAAYVPVDPEYPDERIRFIIEDCKPRAILTMDERINDSVIPVLDLKDEQLQKKTPKNPERVNSSHDLAYCIYTSGTTGRPKGVLIEHRGVANMLCQFKSDFGVITEKDRILQFANVSFDGSVWDYGMALFRGAALYIPGSSMIHDANLIAEYVRKNRISVAFFTPIYYLQSDIHLENLLITAGAAAERKAVEHSLRYCNYINAYGPTEGTVTATHWFCSKGNRIPDVITIGKPEFNKQIYIMNDEKLCGIGVPGELCITGEGVARGYLNLPELTAEKFIDNPFGDGKMYLSGDLAKWLPDGNIVYLGRIDEQVKIRGFRIELSGIETVIRAIDYIKECAVIVREDSAGDQVIFAYYVSDRKIDPLKIKNKIGVQLPDYMVPTGMMQIEEIPLTVNGKLDKKALPEIKITSMSEYAAPYSTEEKLLCHIFSEVLGIEKVGLMDRFYELGGDSIKAIRIAARFGEAGYKLSVKDILSAGTLGNLVSCLEITKQIYAQDKYVGDVKPTPVQKDFLHEWNIKNYDHFCQAVLLKSGELQENALKKALEKLAFHHDMLRAVYEEGKIIVKDTKGFKIPFYFFDISGIDDKRKYICERSTDIMVRMSIDSLPVLRAAVFKDGETWHLFLAIHHLVVDAVSWQILIEDLESGYDQYLRTGNIHLPEKTAGFALWTETLYEYTKTPEFSQAVEYWKRAAVRLRDCTSTPLLSLLEVRDYYVQLDESITSLLVGKAKTAYAMSVDELLLAALVATAAQKYGWRIVPVQVEAHGRECHFINLSNVRTVGWFTSTFCFAVDVGDSLENTLICTKEEYRMAQRYGIEFGLCKMAGLCDFGKTPIFGLNYMGEEDDIQSDGIFQQSDYTLGEEIDKYNLIGSPKTFNISIKKGKLEVVFSCHEALEDDCMNENLLNSFIENLKEILSFCSGINQEQKTLVDYQSNDIGLQDIDAINELLSL